MTEFLIRLAERATFTTARYTKLDLARGSTLFLGLNCFEPGQMQAAHTHADADKFYLVLAGKARMRVGAELVVATAGDLIWCPAGLSHGVEEALERTTMVVGMGG